MVPITLFLAFFCGVFAVASQSYLAREFLVVFQGNEMSLAVLFAGWLAGVGIGAAAGRSRTAARPNAAYLAAAVVAGWAVLFPAALVAVRLSRLIFGVAPGAYASLWQIVGSAALIVGAFSAVSGLAFVILCRVAAAIPGRPVTPGVVYASEAAGSAAGGLAFTFLLAGRVSPFTAGFGCLVAACVLSAALAVCAGRRSMLAPRAAGTAVVGMALLALACVPVLALGRGAIIDANSALRRMQSICPGFVVDSRETRYQNLTTVMISGQYTVFGNCEAIMTFPEELLEEREAFVILAEHPDPSRVLVIGGGPSFVAAVLAYGVEHVDYIELDPGVVSAARKYLPSRVSAAVDDPRVRVRFGDARAMVTADASTKYDAAIVRIGDPRSLLLNRLGTREFMQVVKSRLSPGGVFALPVVLADGCVQGDIGRYGGIVYHTMKSVFADVLATPDVQSVFLASPERGVLTSDVGELSRRFAARNVRSALYPAYYAAIFPREETASLNGALARMSVRSINTDMKPATYAANLRLWAEYSQSSIAMLLFQATEAPAGVFVSICTAGLFWFLALPAICRRSPSSSAATAVLFTGFAAMSLSVVIFYAFQVLAGYVYEWIGVLTAAFLGGIAGGGAVAARRVRSGAGLLAAEILATLAPLAIAAVLFAVYSGLAGSIDARYALLAAALVSGFAAGYEFPIAVAALSKQGVTPDSAASRIQFRDQLGACIGACLAGVVLVPSLGIIWTLVVLSVVKSFSLLAVIVAARGQTPVRQG